MQIPSKYDGICGKTGVPGGKTTVELLGSLISLSTLQCQSRKRNSLSLLQPNLGAFRAKQSTDLVVHRSAYDYCGTVRASQEHACKPEHTVHGCLQLSPIILPFTVGYWLIDSMKPRQAEDTELLRTQSEAEAKAESKFRTRGCPVRAYWLMTGLYLSRVRVHSSLVPDPIGFQWRPSRVQILKLNHHRKVSLKWIGDPYY